MGRVIPGLAASWTLDADGRTWIVTLRDGAQFSDGTPVTAADVRDSWSREGSGDRLHPHVNRMVESVALVADRALAIRLRNRRVDVPVALAHPDLAVAKRVTGSPWPLGTRGAWIATDAGVLPAVASAAVTVERAGLPAVRFLVARGDLRDLLDHRVDLLLTREPAVLGYALTLPQFESVSLAWQRTHVLLTPESPGTAPSIPDAARHVLAGDAVRGEARGAQGPFWWQTWEACRITAPTPPRAARPSTRRIVYGASDRVARDLAERFVGVTRAPGADAGTARFDRATGLIGTAFAVALRDAADAGYIVSLDNRPLDPCRDLYVLLESAPWLDPATIVPLVDTRLLAVVRRGVGDATTEWDGGLLLGRHTQ